MTERGKAEEVFDEMSARQLGEIVRVIARDRGVQAAAVTIVAEEDRNAVRFVVCAPCAAMGETAFGQIVGDRVGEWFTKPHAVEAAKMERGLDRLAADLVRVSNERHAANAQAEMLRAALLWARSCLPAACFDFKRDDGTTLGEYIDAALRGGE